MIHRYTTSSFGRKIKPKRERKIIMTTRVKPIPDGFHTVTPYLSVKGAAQAIEFYKRAFGAQERYRLPGPDGKTVGHAEIVVGNSILMMADEMPDCGNHSPQTLNGSPVCFAVYVEDADAAFKRAVDAGATVTRPLADQFYGDRAGTVKDPFGHQWTLMTHKEDVSAEEMKRRLPGEYAKMTQHKKS
jgi:PhnB protein